MPLINHLVCFAKTHKAHHQSACGPATFAHPTAAFIRFRKSVARVSFSGCCAIQNVRSRLDEPRGPLFVAFVEESKILEIAKKQPTNDAHLELVAPHRHPPGSRPDPVRRSTAPRRGRGRRYTRMSGGYDESAPRF